MGDLEADLAGDLLSTVERLAAACTAGIDAAQMQDICGITLRDESRPDLGYLRYTGSDPRALSLLDSVSLQQAIADADGVRKHRSTIEIGVKPGLQSSALRDRWGHSTGFYMVSPTFQGSSPRHQNMTTENYTVRGINVFVCNSGDEVTSLEIDLPIPSRG